MKVKADRPGPYRLPAIKEKHSARGREDPNADRPIGNMAGDHDAGGQSEPRATRMGELLFGRVSPPFPQRSPPRPLCRGSLRWFGPRSCNPGPRGRPSSLVQQGCFEFGRVTSESPRSTSGRSPVPESCTPGFDAPLRRGSTPTEETTANVNCACRSQQF